MKTTKRVLGVECLEGRTLLTANPWGEIAAPPPPPVRYESALIYVAQAHPTADDTATAMHHCNIDRLYH